MKEPLAEQKNWNQKDARNHDEADPLRVMGQNRNEAAKGSETRKN